MDTIFDNIWELQPVEQTTVREVSRRHRIDLLTATILVRRGISSSSQVASFLTRGGDTHECSSIRIEGMEEAVERFGSCREERVFVFGDPCVDGIAAVAIIVDLLQIIGAHVEWKILAGGQHGLSIDDFEVAQRSGASLVICVGCSLCSDEAEAAAEAGIDMIVVNNHRPVGHLPEVLVLLISELLGTGSVERPAVGIVALKLFQAVSLSLMNNSCCGEEMINSPYDLAALSALANRMPLIGECRRIVTLGLETMARTKRLGFQEIWDRLGHSGPTPTAEECSRLLNSALSSAACFSEGNLAVSLLVSRDRAVVSSVADAIMELDARRRSETDKAWSRLLPKVRHLARKHDKAFCLVAEDSALIRGLAGPLAFRLSRFFSIPVAVVVCESGCVSGSVRSPDGGTDVLKLFAKAKGLITAFGGYKNTGGFLAPLESLEKIRCRWSQGDSSTRTVGIKSGKPNRILDAELPAPALKPDLDRLVRLMEPTGVGNRPVALRTKRLRVAQVSLFGRESEHCKLLFDAGAYRWPAVYWGGGHKAGNQIHLGDVVDVVYRIAPEHLDGMRRLRMVVLDICR